MTNNQLTDKSTIGARIAALLVADSVPLSDAWKALIDDAERTELQEHRKAAPVERIDEIALQAGINPDIADAYMQGYQDGEARNSPVFPDGWIPVSERMPEDNSDVLCATEFDGPSDWRRKVGYRHEGKWVVYGASWSPTHWQPLPAPPKEVG